MKRALFNPHRTPWMRRFLLVSSFLVFSAATIVAQSASPTETDCRAPGSSRSTLRIQEAESVPEIRALDVRFEGSPKLVLSEQNQIAAEIMDVVEEDRRGWQERIEERVGYAWQVRGFFHVKVHTTEIRELSSSPESKNVALTFQLEAGEQYRLAQIKFKNATQFTDVELRRFFPINDGEILDVHKLGDGIEAMRRAYAELGFINFTAIPETTDEQNQRISLDLDLDEGQQFHISGIKLLGRNQGLIAPLLRQYKIEPGEVFDVRRLDEFSRDLRSLPGADLLRFIDQKNATVCLQIAFTDSSD